MGEAKRRAERPTLISVLVPERGRPEMLERLICSLIDTAGSDHQYEILVAIDNDDPEWVDREPLAHSHTRYLRRPRPVTLGEKLNEMAREARGDIFWFIANDMVIETADWPAKFREACAKLPNGMGVPFVHDDLHQDHAAYWLMTRKMRDAIGFYAAPWFPYWFIDTVANEWGILLGVRFEIDVKVSAPEGRGKTHGLVDLPFWVHFFNETRPMRVRDAINLASIAYGEGSRGQAEVMSRIASRNAECVARSQHLSSPMFLERWSDTAASPPSPQYPEVKAYAERQLTMLREQAPRRVRVAVCVPSGRTWEATCANCVAAAAAFSASAGVDLAFLNVQTSSVTHGRNSTVQLALQENVDYIWFVDSDMKFPPDALMRLLQHGKDICGATYNKRVADPQTGRYETLGRLKGPRPENIHDGLHEALLMPGGMMLIKADVYRKLKWPWYAECYRWEGDDGVEAFKALLRDYFVDSPPEEMLDDFGRTLLAGWLMDNYVMGEAREPFKYWSEDLFFARKARKNGFSLWCDIGLTYEMTHLGTLEVTTLKPTEEQKAMSAAAE